MKMADSSVSTSDHLTSTSENGKQLHISTCRVDTLRDDCTEVHAVQKSISTTCVQVEDPPEFLEAQKAVSAVCCTAGSSEDSEVASAAAAVEELGNSFVTAVHKKYNDDADADYSFTKPGGDIVFVPRSGPVKMTASGNIMLPKQVSMSGCQIAVAGDRALIQKMCQKVHELDLMENNIKSWEEVLGIIECIPNLTFLNLTKNQLTSDMPDLKNRRLPHVTQLVLNSTMVTWDAVLQLLEAFPRIEELHLSLNGFKSVSIPISKVTTTSSLLSASTTLTNYPNLRKLFFVGNNIVDWREFNKLGAFFPQLEYLLISETDLKEIEGADDIADCFPCLQTLGLNRTHLKSWDEIEKLRLFPCLHDVRLNGVPFLEEFAEKFRRQHTVALLPNITTLNGSPIKDAEREDAERFYIRLYMDKEEKTTRYFELEKQHGKLVPLAKVIFKPQLHVRLKVRVEGPNQELIKAEEMDIDVNQTVRDLKKLLSNVAGCSVAKFQLFYHDIDGGDYSGPERLPTSDRKLHSYSMRDGDELIIACKE